MGIVFSEYQKEAIDWTLKLKTTALYYDMGTGKTYITAGIIQKLWNPTFIGLGVVPLNNIDTTWLKLLKTMFRVYTDFEEFKQASLPKLLIIHYEVTPKIIEKLKKFKWTFIFYDEAHRMKDRNSLTARTAAKLRHHDCYKTLLTGTPLDERPVDLFSQFRFLVPDLLGEWKDFEDEFLEPIDINLKKYRPGSFKFRLALRRLMIAKRKRQIDPKKVLDLVKRLSPYIRHVEASEVLDLPSHEIIEVPVTLRGAQRDLYDQLDMRGIVPGLIKAPNRAVRNQKLLEICGGYIIDEEGETREVGRAKLRKTLSIIKNHPKPIVIFFRYIGEIEGLRKELKGRVRVFTGKISKDERNQTKEDFQKGKIDYLLSQVRTGGVGIDLFSSSVAIVYSSTYSRIDFDQAIKRLIRRGQRKNVKIFLIYARDTVDERRINVIENKTLKARQFLHHFQKRR